MTRWSSEFQWGGRELKIPPKTIYKILRTFSRPNLLPIEIGSVWLSEVRAYYVYLISFS